MPAPSSKPASPTDYGWSKCPVCRSNKIDLYLRDDRSHAVTAADFGSSRKTIHHGTILRCRDCGFGFQDWRPSEGELASLYRDLDPEIYEQESDGRLRTAKRHLQIVKGYAPRGRLLDVGCASGAFLSCAADHGFDVIGIEPSTVLSSKATERLHGRGQVLCAALHDAGIPKSSVDVLTLWDVLEHVPDPLQFLSSCAALVKVGGHVVANVPDLESWQARALGKRWPLLLAEHLNYFSRGSLALLGDQAQLQALRFGRRPSSFSLNYVMYRLAQHKVPGATVGYSTVRKLGLGSISIPAFLGETYVVWKRADSVGRAA